MRMIYFYFNFLDKDIYLKTKVKNFNTNKDSLIKFT